MFRNLSAIGVLLAVASAGLAREVGPGPYGYTITDQLQWPFEDISATGTRILAGDDDSHVYVPDVGFWFPYMGTTFRDVSISTNGCLVLGEDAAPGHVNGPIPRANVYGVDDDFIAVFWDDLRTFQDAVYYQTQGTPGDRRFIVQYNLVDHYPGTPQTATFSATLYESGRIILQYPDTYFGDLAYDYGQSATVGIQEDPNSGLEWSFIQALVPSGTDLTIVPEPISLVMLAGGGLLILGRRRAGRLSGRLGETR